MWKTLATALLLALGVGTLQGCAYDPSTGTYVPCCAYPAYPAYPAYGYGYYPPPVVGGVVVGPGWRRW